MQKLSIKTKDKTPYICKNCEFLSQTMNSPKYCTAHNQFGMSVSFADSCDSFRKLWYLSDNSSH